jgi:UDP-N-acetylmuramate dehydrogenase
MTIIPKIIEFLETEHISFDIDVDLKTKTWIKRGGIARLWVQPAKISDFENFVVWCQMNKIQFEVIGNTSNCYFMNDYNPELVISTLKLNEVNVDYNTITCDCGVNMSRLAKYCISNGIAGFEGFIGLPGTVGGAAINNSGCYGSLISKVVKSVLIINNGEKLLLTNEKLNYRFRNSALKSKEVDGVVTFVTFNIDNKEDPIVLEKRAQEFQIHRKTYQEQTYPNLGSTFCNIEFKKPSFLFWCINAIVHRLLNFLIKNPLEKQKARTKIFLILSGARTFRKYVSDYGIGCFTWKDPDADQAFIDYMAFIIKNSIYYELEIDIKKEKCK